MSIGGKVGFKYSSDHLDSGENWQRETPTSSQNAGLSG
jgi:hypothetical protein